MVRLHLRGVACQSGDSSSSLFIRGVLAGIGLLIAHPLDDPKIPSGQQGTEARPDPVDPVISRELPASDGAPEASRRVEGAARRPDA